jgi:hypothetical protein
MPLQLDITQALGFLDQLDPGGRHTVASEAPFGGKDGGPKWEIGCTYEADQRQWLREDIQKRQARRSNVYYGVNRPCSATKQQGSRGKCNVDDIVAIRALAFDIDITKRPFDNKLLLDFVDQQLTDALRPSLLINTGGGFHLIYLLKETINVQLFRPAINDEQESENDQIKVNRSAITRLGREFETLLRALIPRELNDHIKIDNMSNVDRVMRLPGTVNFPKAEKVAKGQVPALAHVAVDYQCKCDIYALRSKVPRSSDTAPVKRSAKARPNPQWPAFRKAMACCEFIRDRGLADFNETYTHWVMLPLIGMIHDENEHNRITLEEAEELFLEAVSGGERYGSVGRGQGYFKRQWRSHRPELARDGTKSFGSLVHFCKENGMALPWSDAVIWEQEFERQHKELAKLKQSLNVEDMRYVKGQDHL